ncbi:hypothetical protein Vadar_022704 [Vaccinium darrowii]|uniref:Uncharacterized protein n=1 Tax=Vaccinium darrowii TaxID=229202 RepID=A0ACB7XTS9_9ERIC|nr:hypothetical protein Vadar_022704 [Vaccinium darrowii]
MAAVINCRELDKAIEESYSQEWSEWSSFYYSPSPSYFPQSPPPPFSTSPPPSCPPSPNSFIVCRLASQSMEISPQNQQHDDSFDPPPRYFDRYWALVQQQLLQLWTDTLNLITRGRIMSSKMSEQYNSQGFIRSPAPQYIGVWQGHGSEWVARIRLRWNWLIIGTFETAEEAAIEHDEAALRAEPTTTPRTEIPPLQSPPTEEQQNPNDPAEGAPFSSESRRAHEGVQNRNSAAAVTTDRTTRKPKRSFGIGVQRSHRE